MKHIRFYVAVFLICISISVYIRGLDIHKEARIFINKVLELSNQNDYTAIYRDLTTDRFKASDNFGNFKEISEEIRAQFGPIKKQKQARIMWDSYKKKEFIFYRTEFTFEHTNGKTYQRIVIMNHKQSNEWKIDGMAIASDEKVFLAQGNLYYFDWINTKGNDIWAPEKVKNIYKDSRSEYLRTTPYSGTWIEGLYRKIRIILFNKSWP